MKTVFDFEDYRAYLKWQIQKQTTPRGYQTRMAEVAGCQPAYFSQVLSGKANLTPDQASKLADAWEIDESEFEYFLNLVDVEKAGSASLQRRLKEKLRRQKEAFRRNHSTYQQPSVEQKSAAELYYSAWVFSAIHVLLSVPSFQDIANLAGHLGLSEPALLKHLQELQEQGLAQAISPDQRRWRQTLKNLHSASASFYSSLHHRNWRLKAIDELAPRRLANLHYTSVSSLSERDFLKIKEFLLSSIDQTRGIIEPSPEEGAACLLIDWFRV